MLTAADALVERAKKDGYNVSLKEYIWGSNMVVCNDAILLAAANSLAPGAEYGKYAETQFDYIFGANPMSMCYLTGFGSVSAQNPHHRPSIALSQPMSGMVIGGPDGKLEDPFAKVALEGTAPAKCYIDNAQSYATNEVTIYWNSPLVCVMAALGKY